MNVCRRRRIYLRAAPPAASPPFNCCSPERLLKRGQPVSYARVAVNKPTHNFPSKTEIANDPLRNLPPQINKRSPSLRGAAPRGKQVVSEGLNEIANKTNGHLRKKDFKKQSADRSETKRSKHCTDWLPSGWAGEWSIKRPAAGVWSGQEAASSAVSVNPQCC